MTTYVIPDPSVGTWAHWAETVIGFNAAFANQLAPHMSWQHFGRRMTLIEPRTPRPEFFKDWRVWATALKRAVD